MSDDCWNHGISASSILRGNASMGEAYTGMLWFSPTALYSYKVYDEVPYPENCNNYVNIIGLNTAAGERAFAAAVALGNDVIVANMQDYQGSVLTTRANNAYDAGVAVIASNGNFGIGPNYATVRSPAEAKKAIGAGAVDVSSLVTNADQGRGPTTPDGRTKPDVQGPTNTGTASYNGWNATRGFGGTSGSTPYVGGAAALLGGFLAGAGNSPGYIYAHLINSGQNFVDPTTNQDKGAGLLLLPGANSTNWTGMLTLTAGQHMDFFLPIPGGSTDLDAALWWPDGASHSDIDMYLLDPWLTVRAVSTSVPTVFEKARIALPEAGVWHLRIVGASIATAQEIFTAQRVKTKPSYTASFMTQAGNYLSATGCGGSDMNASAVAQGDCETFTLYDLDGPPLVDGDRVQLRYHGNKFRWDFVRAVSGGCPDLTFPYSSCRVNVDTPGASAAETFTLRNMNCGGCPIYSGSQISLQSVNGYFVAAEYGGANGCGGCYAPVNANRQSPAAWETFTITYW